MTKPVKDHSNKNMTEEDFSFLMQTQFFEAIPDDARFHLLSAMTAKTVPAGERFIRQGEEGNCLYIIQEGTCAVTLEREGAAHPLERFGPGDIVGEMAILTGEKRSAHVDAEVDMVLWLISRKSFDPICEEFPQLREFLTRLVTNRLTKCMLTAERVVGKYVADRVIGSGGGSVVYQGYHSALSMPVAIKMLKHTMAMDHAFVELFRNEAKIIAQLNHENIVKVYDVEELYRTFFIVMEYVEGVTLKQVLEQPDRPALPTMVDCLLQLCFGLQHAHEKGVIHRDIKPGNVLVQKDSRIKIFDFGLACTPGTRDEYVSGTVLYLSPEQIKGDPMDDRTDIYSLGIMAHEMFTGRKACPVADTATVLNWHLKADIEDPRLCSPDLPDELADFLIRATNRDPEQRYQKVSQIIYELMPLADKLGVGAGRGPGLDLNMMSLFLFYRPEQHVIMQRLVKDFSRELQKVGARLRGVDFKDVQQ